MIDLWLLKNWVNLARKREAVEQIRG